MSRHSRELSQIADELEAERARHAEVMRKLNARCCLQCFQPLDCKPYPAAAPAWCAECESARGR